MKHKLHRKLLGTVIGISLLVNMVSFGILVVIYNGVRLDRIDGMEEKIKQQIGLFLEETQLEKEKICDIVATEEYFVKTLSREEAKREYEGQYEQLIRGITVKVPHHNQNEERLLFLQEDTIFEISYMQDAERFFTFLFYVGSIILLLIVLGAMITGRISKRLLQPVYEVIGATSKVAEGDFSVQLEEKKSGEFEHLIHNFNTMVAELGSIETLRSDFVSNVSHEFKTPIASIQGFAKLLQCDGITSEERKEYTDIIVAETERLSKLSSNILRLSRLENQTSEVKKAPFDLAEQIRGCIMLLEREWEQKTLDMRIELEEATVCQNEELLQQVWINLLQNAIKFTEVSGKISIQLLNLEHTVLVKMKDSGIGMSEETRAHIFDKFYQGDGTRKEEGNGLGLALVKKIIDLCNGKISVRSVEGQGSMFQVELPKS